LASASYVALIMRAAPPGLQGTMMMSASAAYFASTRIGDLLGSALYGWAGNFMICVILSTAVYATIWFLLPSAIEADTL
jgi:predicted MFS family arabinose efflux permease